MSPSEARVARVRALLARDTCGYPAASRWLETPHGKLHYVDEGPRAAPVLVFVHGNPTWSFAWRRAIARFSPTHRVVALDHLGCGLSDLAPQFPARLADHALNLRRLIAALDLTRITLVVHDWGGAIGLLAALDELDRLEGVVALNTAAFLPTFDGATAPWRIRACRAPLVGPLLVRGANVFLRAALSMALVRPERLSAHERALYLAPHGEWSERRSIMRFVEDIPLAPRHASWPALERLDRSLERLADLRWQLIWGERDFCFTPRYRREFERRFPRAASVPLGDAGHWVFEDQPQAVLDALERFVRAAPNRPRTGPVPAEHRA